jgi:hypothetical protein
MSLNWDARNVTKEGRAALEKRHGEKLAGQIVAYFCWVLMSVDIGEVTDKNVDEILFRDRVAFKIIGGTALQNYTPDAADVRALIGYTSNVSTRSRRQFMSKMARVLENTVRDEMRRAQEGK